MTERRRRFLRDVLMQEGLDILFLQETKLSTSQQEIQFVDDFKNNFWTFHSIGISGSAGTAVMLRKSKNVALVDCVLEQTGRIASVDFLWHNQLVRAISLYAPNTLSDRYQFFRTLRHFIDTPCNVIVGGDFNCVIRKQDCTYTRGHRDGSVTYLEKLLVENNLIDVMDAGDSCPTLRFTHWQGSSHARLDRIYMSAEMTEKIKKYEVRPLEISDHGLVTCCLASRRVSQSLHSKGVWKMNESILDDEEFIGRVRGMIDVLKTQENDIACKWELFKQQLKMTAIEHSQIKAWRKREERNVLATTMKDLLKEEERTPGTFQDDIRTAKAELLKLAEKKFHGDKVRSRMCDVARDENPTKIFGKYERERYENNKIARILDGNTLMEGQQAIEDTFRRTYETLFKPWEGDESKQQEIFQYMPKITEEDVEKGKGPIRVNEVRRAVRKLSANKAPGPDGIGAKFYKVFIDELCPLLSRVYQDIFNKQLLTPSMRQCYTIFIPKKKKNNEAPCVSDFRPISLLCTDYKILAKITTRRLEGVLWKVIGDHQSYGIKGRKIVTNLHKMRVVCEKATSGGPPVAVLQVDLSQAFDRVSHQYLFALLKWCGIGEDLQRLVNTCYNDIWCQLMINKRPGPKIRVARSVRQGCPMSPVLFALYLEPFCRYTAQSKTIKGLRIGDEVIKLLAYADDVAIICTAEEGLGAALQHVKDFCDCSGAAVNLAKSTGAWLGEWIARPRKFLGMEWTTSIPRYLGVPLHLGEDTTAKWNAKVATIQWKMSAYNGRDLSLFNRAHVCNTVAYPSFLYWARIITVNRKSVDAYHRMNATFVWRSKFERMRRSNLYLPLEAGGFGLVNAALKVNVQRFCYYRDERNPFLRSALQQLGAAFLGGYVVTSASCSVRSPCLRFYEEIAESIQFFSLHFSWEYLNKVTPKTLYWDSISKLFPPPLYRLNMVETKGKCVFRRLRKMPVARSTKDFFIKFHAEVLPVKGWLENKGFPMPLAPTCHACGQYESIRHVFMDCKTAFLFWSDLRVSLGMNYDINWKLLKFLHDGECKSEVVDEVVLITGLHALWRARTDVVMCEVRPRAVWWHFREKMLWVCSVVEEKGQGTERWSALKDIVLRFNASSFGCNSVH